MNLLIRLDELKFLIRIMEVLFYWIFRVKETLKNENFIIKKILSKTYNILYCWNVFSFNNNVTYNYNEIYFYCTLISLSFYWFKSQDLEKNVLIYQLYDIKFILPIVY